MPFKKTRPITWGSYDTTRSWQGSGPPPFLIDPSANGNPLKLMPPGHFCPDVCGIEDFGEADFLRGRVVRAFFRLMQLWPKKR